MNKFSHLLGFVESLFDDKETARKAAEIIKGMIQAHHCSYQLSISSPVQVVQF